MNDRLPPEIQVHSLRQGVSFELPIRPIGSLRVVGKWLARAGLAGSCFLVVLFLSRLFKAFLSQPNWPVFSVFSLLSLAPFFVLSFGLFMIGRFMVAGRCRVTLEGGQLRVTERAGWLHWTRVRSLKGLRSFEVKAGQAPPTGAAPAGAGVVLELATLHAEFEGGKPMWVLAGYPRAWLLALARELSHQLEHGAVSAEAASPAIEVVEKIVPIGLGDSSAFAPVPDRLTQPVKSRVRLERQGQAVMLVLPPQGLRSGSKSLFVFGLVWCGFTMVCSVLFLSGWKGAGPSSLGALPAVALFWAVGIGMVLYPMQVSQRRALVSAGGDTLKIAQKGLFGARRWEWSRPQIVALQAGPSGVKVNDKPLLELQVHLADGTKRGFFTERDEDELQWMATVLRHALQIPNRLTTEDSRWTQVAETRT